MYKYYKKYENIDFILAQNIRREDKGSAYRTSACGTKGIALSFFRLVYIGKILSLIDKYNLSSPLFSTIDLYLE